MVWWCSSNERHSLVAELLRPFSRADDVREEHGRQDLLGFGSFAKSGQKLPDLRDDLIGDVEPGHVVLARQLDEAGSLDLLGEPAALRERDDRVPGHVHDERRHVDRRRDVPDVELAAEPHERHCRRG